MFSFFQIGAVELLSAALVIGATAWLLDGFSATGFLPAMAGSIVISLATVAIDFVLDLIDPEDEDEDEP